MTEDPADRSRRGFLSRGLAAGAGGLVAAVLPAHAAPAPGVPASDVEPFWGEHQGGIATPQQRNTYFAAFDLGTKQRAQVEQLLRD
jgi:deferrochelatase/peroxidase EfeB